MKRLTWPEITRRYPDEWMLLVGTDDDGDGKVGCARILDHDRSVLALLDRTGLVPGATVIHTAGRPLCVTPGFSSRKPRPKRVAKLCHGAADPAGSSQTTTDEETR